MPPPIPSIPKPFLEDHVAADSDVDVKMQDWQEPHPGRRLSHPHGRTTNWDAFTGDAGGRGGMAAEGRWPDDCGFSFAVPAGRGQSKNPPSQLVLSDSGQSNKPEIQTAPLGPTNLRRGDSSVSIDVVTSEMAPSDTGDIYSADVSGTDSDTEGISMAPPRRKMSLAPLDTTSQALQMSDFSNHLGIRMEVDDGPTSFSTASSNGDAFCTMYPDDDRYGWDAVLTRKTNATQAPPPAPSQQRRASRSKRSLLQRVFSPGGSTPDETPQNSHTSFAWPKHRDL